MLTVHHLNNSRSQRVLWLLVELGVPYEIKPYRRDAARERGEERRERHQAERRQDAPAARAGERRSRPPGGHRAPGGSESSSGT